MCDVVLGVIHRSLTAKGVGKIDVNLSVLAVQPIQYVLHEDDDGREKKGPSNVSFDAVGSDGEVS